MLYIDDGQAGRHRQAFRSAAKRFWEMHQDESLYVRANGTGSDGFRVSTRRDSDQLPSPLVVQIGTDLEGAILTALEKWWAGRQ
jgi:hypothetical protein